MLLTKEHRATVTVAVNGTTAVGMVAKESEEGSSEMTDDQKIKGQDTSPRRTARCKQIGAFYRLCWDA